MSSTFQKWGRENRFRRGASLLKPCHALTFCQATAYILQGVLARLHHVGNQEKARQTNIALIYNDEKGIFSEF